MSLGHHHGDARQGFKTHLAQAEPSRFVAGIAAIVNPALALREPAPIDGPRYRKELETAPSRMARDTCGWELLLTTACRYFTIREKN